MIPGNSDRASGVGVSTPCGVIWARGVIFFRPWVVGVEKIYGRMYEPDKGPIDPEFRAAPHWPKAGGGGVYSIGEMYSISWM